MRTLLKTAERSGVIAVLAGDVNQRLPMSPIRVDTAKDLIFALSQLSDKGIVIVIAVADGIFDMITSVSRPLGIKNVKIIDAEYVDSDLIAYPVKNRLSILEPATIEDVGFVASHFKKQVSEDDNKPTAGDAVDALLRKKDEDGLADDDDY